MVYHEKLTKTKVDELIGSVKMITKIVSQNFDIPDSHKLEVALANGRYSSIDKLFQ